MSIRLVLVACLLAVGLGAALYFLGPAAPGGSEPAAALLDFDPARVTRIDIEGPGEPPHIIAVRPDRSWGFLSEPGQSPADAWPVHPEFPRALLRSLDAAPREASGAQQPPPSEGVLAVTLHFVDGRTETLTFDPRPLGGRARAWVGDAGPFLVPVSVLDATASPPAWRIPAAMPGVNRFNPASLALRTPDDTILLTRRDNRWYIDEPVSAVASPGAVGATLGALASLEVLRFIDDPDQAAIAAANFDHPALVVEATLSQPPASDEPPAVVSLTVGGPASPDGATAFARCSRAPSVILVIPTAPLSPLPSTAAGFLPATAASVAPSDIGGIGLTSAATAINLTRELDSWSGVVDGEQRAASPRLRDSAQSLLTFLAETPGSAHLRSTLPEGESIATIELRSLSGGLLQRIEVLDLGGQVALASGEVGVVYERAALPTTLADALPAPQPDSP